MDNVNTANRFSVMLKEGAVFFPAPIPRTMTKPDALVLAAWIVLLADWKTDEFSQVLREVRARAGDIR